MGVCWSGSRRKRCILARAAYLLAILTAALVLLPRAWRVAAAGPAGHARADVDRRGRRGGAGQWDEAATVAFLFGLSEALEALSLERARRAVRKLLEVAPETAEVVDDRAGR